jgi:hypothetical protein
MDNGLLNQYHASEAYTGLIAPILEKWGIISAMFGFNL